MISKASSESARLNKYCLIDPTQFDTCAAFITYISSFGSFSGWWIENWPNDIQKECERYFKLDSVGAKTLRKFLNPRFGFRLISRGIDRHGLESWDDLPKIRDHHAPHIDVCVGRKAGRFKSLNVHDLEHLEILSEMPRQVYLPPSISIFQESISILASAGGPSWVVDPHLQLWDQSTDSDGRFNSLKVLTEELQKYKNCDVLNIIVKWDSSNSNNKRGTSDPRSPETSKFLAKRLASLVKPTRKNSFQIHIYLDELKFMKGHQRAQELANHQRFFFNNHGGVEYDYGLASDFHPDGRSPKRYVGFIAQTLNKQLRESYGACNPVSSSMRFRKVGSTDDFKS